MADAALRGGRDPAKVRLIPVTKSVGEAEARVLAELGYTELAENRVDVARPKIEALGADLRWHMVGHIQRKKARDVVALFDRVDSVDRMDLAEELNKRCAAANKRLEVLIQVNVSGEASKGGFSCAETPEACGRIMEMEQLDVRGLMTMAPIVEDVEETRACFAKLAELGARLNLPELSMGMSQDFEVAVEEGATEVRIGTALFK